MKILPSFSARVLPALLMLALVGCQARPLESGLPGVPAPEPVPGYLTAPAGGPLKNAHGQCWRTAEWRPVLAIEECDPAVVRENQQRQRELELALAAVAPAGAPEAATSPAAGAVAEPVATEADAAAAAPAPVPAPALNDFTSKPVVLNTDAAFFFGKYRLTPAGKEAVENLAAYIRMWGIEGVQVEITGHTDRIGNEKDNLLLSKRRADAVRQVLVDAGVSADAIVARGVGSTRPVTAPDDCPGDLVRCDLISCLAPDRRVEVGLKGTRKAPVR